ncbi:putative phosphorylase kinase, gamma [Lyophyllum shimeji]|uniref:Phosphorylase kinase, gamma n=1 Tax=Lyophyllum shimeji TaxID=47721 RepID=A0A9P3UP28_LYOSH|nr:putative phosphorylase kinase, gamma [Lyophyllum shimeji]
MALSSPTLRASPSPIRGGVSSPSRVPRGALAAITNTAGHPDDRDGRSATDSPTTKKGKAPGDFVTPPTSPSSGVTTNSWRMPEEDDEEEDSVPGPFRKIRVIQKQPHSEVVAVRDMNGGLELRRGRPMCLKIMRRETEEQMIVRELRAYKALSHAGGSQWLAYVMRLEASLEGADDEGIERVYFVMDMMDCDLMDVMMSWDLELRRIHRKQWVAQIATGIEAIHAAGVIHRDLKPENILVDFRLNVRIGDFGCSFVNPTGRGVSCFGSYSDEIVGTWPYHAPEVLANRGKAPRDRRKYSIHVDYWALGLIVFELEQDAICPTPLFHTEADLWAYCQYKALEHGGRSYFVSKGYHFDPVVESLLKGLIEVSVSHRMERHKIRSHEYFQRGDGHNEFHNIKKRGRDLNKVPVGHDVPSERLKREGERDIYTPIAYAPDDHTGDNYSWINPQGIWGANLDNIYY